MVIWCHSILILKIISIENHLYGLIMLNEIFFFLHSLHLGVIMTLLNERAGILVGGGKKKKN